MKSSQDKTQEALEKITSISEVWKNQFGELFITIKLDENRQKHYTLTSRHTRAYISKVLSEVGIHTKTKQNVENIIAQLESDALLNDIEYETNLRVAGFEGAIYIHLRDKENTIIKVDADGWNEAEIPPVRFVESQHLKALPYPSREGKIEDIDKLLNVENVQDRNMILCWAFNALFPTGPYPILMLTGQQGSAKTTTTKLVRSLVDPAKPLARSLPSDDRNLMVSATNNWILSYDNLSKISDKMSDSLCRIATGAGMGIRANYTDKEEIVFDAALPVILNGIENSATRLDLLDRSIVISLPTMTQQQRKPLEEILALQNQVLPSVFGALLDTLSEALKRLPSFEALYLPRMADFAKRILSVESFLGWSEGEFLPYFESLMDDASSQAMEGDIVLQGILQLMNGKEEWSGTATELREKIRTVTSVDYYKYIPKANRLALNRRKPALEKLGIEYSFKRTGNQRQHIFKRNADIVVNDCDEVSAKMTLDESLNFTL